MQTVFGKLALLQRLECAEADMQADGFAFEARCIDFGQQAGREVETGGWGGDAGGVFAGKAGLVGFPV